jgi:hypothetical protein
MVQIQFLEQLPLLVAVRQLLQVEVTPATGLQTAEALEVESDTGLELEQQEPQVRDSLVAIVQLVTTMELVVVVVVQEVLVNQATMAV